MSNPKEDVTPEPLRLNHSALGGYRMPGIAHLEGETVQVVAPRGALAQAPEPLRPIDPAASGPLKPGSKLE